jgi:hypothetical protein
MDEKREEIKKVRVSEFEDYLDKIWERKKIRK